MTTTDADRVIAALHAGHDELAPFVAALDGDRLRHASAAAEWDVSQVVSHLGSGAVITRTTLEAALRGDPNPGFEANKPVWDRWNAMSPEQRRDEFLAANAALLAAYDALDDDTRATLRVDLGFLPEPVDVATAGRFRLNEFALHAWDIRATFDERATVRADAVPLLLDQSLFMLGWLGKTEALGGRELTLAVRLHDPQREFALRLADGVATVDVPAEPDAVLDASGEAWLRLVSGRFKPPYLSDDLAVSGALDLDTVRQIFPGY